ncbi:ribonuclease HII [Enterococcus caccae]|uniref:Ribonuclease HII n=1 Tax=Enterococcus caccae ATCC BAA-1240 TaxID=1158612 RepID=R3TT77_9ENTE|nr:ribonuclease HII [Enterococcus caccae]EOL44383.1 ribonuclease HII [Enterococcus caccae ATCC BAA-1240]EOT68501.1 ribonuclease HII [Enterococcus caccae ATCC BAA-1240]
MKTESIQQIKAELATINTREDKRIKLWQADERNGVQQALAQWDRKLQRHEKEVALFEEMQQFENSARAQGHRLIVGIDEVGRGPLAGPVVAAAVILPENFQLLGVNDSKKLSAKKRDELYDEIQNQAISIGIGMVDHNKIDEINIYQASKLAMGIALEDLCFIPDYLLIDAMKLDVKIPQESIIKGDARSVSIAAASIVAKVIRDRLMEDYGKMYPGYGFEKNAGYGTKEHLLGLQKQGICTIHRKTFAPIKDMC